MKLDITQVFENPGECLQREVLADLTEVALWGEKPFPQPLPVLVTAANRAGVVTITLACSTTLRLTCDRCLEAFQQPFTLESSHTAVRELFGKDEDEFVVLPDGVLDVDQLAITDIVLALPYRKLCSEECKGLCPICGCNRNHTPCNCMAPAIDPRLSALDNITF